MYRLRRKLREQETLKEKQEELERKIREIEQEFQRREEKRKLIEQINWVEETEALLSRQLETMPEGSGTEC